MALRGGLITSRPLCYAADGRHFYAPCGSDVRVYSARSGDHVATLRGHADAVTAVAVDPSNARQLYSASLDGTVKLWRLDDGACARTIAVDEPVEHMVRMMSCVCWLWLCWGQESRRCMAAAGGVRAAGGARHDSHSSSRHHYNNNTNQKN